MVVLVPSELEGDDVGEEEGEEEDAHGEETVYDVTPDDGAPFGPAVDVEDTCVVEVEECLGDKEKDEGQQGFIDKVRVYVVGV